MQRQYERTKIIDPFSKKALDQVPPNKCFNREEVMEYLYQFGVVGPDDTLNTDNLSQILFSAYLNHFNKAFRIEEQAFIDEYHERIFNLVENLRNHTEDNILVVLDYLHEANPYTLDLVIMTWCLPRQSNYLSEQVYLDRYKALIHEHNHKLVKLVSSKAIKQFCVEALVKTNYVPMHCLDLLWYYMDAHEIEIKFTDGITSKWIGIEVDAEQPIDTLSIQIIINMEYILKCGLGKVANMKNKTFENLLIIMMSTSESIESLKKISTGKIFYNQYLKIKTNPQQYFGREVKLI